MSTAFAAFVAGHLSTESFNFVDIGCSGGIDPAWRVFGDRLRAFAFDASIEECERLAREEAHPGVRYIGGFVGLPADHPLSTATADMPFHVRNPFPRTSAARTYDIQKSNLERASLDEKLRNNAWNLTALADPAVPVVVPDVIALAGWEDVDLLKIDIDGPDFHVLHSFDGAFDKLDLLAARLEVNLSGGVGVHEHTFHNTDRFMRERGYELLGLDVRTYAMAALPSRFAITAPAQTVSGRPVQAEAFYARDPAGRDWHQVGTSLTTEKLAKLGAIFSVWGQPDAAAELLLAYRDRLRLFCDVEVGLELLAGQAQEQARKALPYRDYIGEFEAGSPSFYPPDTTIPPRTFMRRLRAGWTALRRPESVTF